jgi:hypothetical protein
MLPVLAGTLFACIRMHQTFQKLGHFVNLSQAVEVLKEGGTPNVRWLKRGHPVTPSQTNLNRSRYKHQDEHLYVVAEDERVSIESACGEFWLTSRRRPITRSLRCLTFLMEYSSKLDDLALVALTVLRQPRKETLWCSSSKRSTANSLASGTQSEGRG